MDKFKEKTFKDYDAYDIRCKFVTRHQSSRKNDINMAKRKARRKLKQELGKEINNE